MGLGPKTVYVSPPNEIRHLSMFCLFWALENKASNICVKYVFLEVFVYQKVWSLCRLYSNAFFCRLCQTCHWHVSIFVSYWSFYWNTYNWNFQLSSIGSQQKKGHYTTLNGFVSYESCIPDCAYTTFYTVFFDKKTFQCIFILIMYQIPFYCIVYCTQSFLFTNTNSIMIILMNTDCKLFFEISIFISSNVIIFIDRMCMKICISSFNIYNLTWIHNI